MRRRKPSAAGTVLLILLLLILAATVGFLSYVFYLKNQDMERMEEELRQMKTDDAALRSDLEELNERIMVLQQNVEELVRSAAAATPASDAISGNEGSLDWNREPAFNPADLIPGEILNEAAVLAQPDDYFVTYTIQYDDQIYQRINGKSYRENEDIALSDLRYLVMPHYNFNHQIQVGEMIVNAAIAQDVVDIFKEFLNNGYEINSMVLVDNYWTGDPVSTDTASIEANNTSCFNYRISTSSGRLSNHALGRAIDVNPQQNPYLWLEGDEYVWHHSNADPYLDRNSGDPHVIVEGDFCWSVFNSHGFTWGGTWYNPVDYQHFEKPA